jgi:TPR repeat protein
MDISYEEAVSQLKLGRAEKRLHTDVPSAVSLMVKRDDGRRCVVKFRSSDQVGSMAHLTGWLTDTHTRRTRRGDTDVEDKFDPVAALLEEFSRQDEASRKAEGRYIVPVEMTGFIDDTAWCLRDWHEHSLQQLIEGKVRPRHSDDLFHLVNNVWTALCFLHQQKLNQPHGNLKPANVLIDPGLDGQWQHVLTDMQMCIETDYIEIKKQDMQSLGMLIAQYCESRSDFRDWGQADSFVSRARWEFLGEKEAEWKKVCRLLLTPEHYPQDYDAESDRHKLLRPLRPVGFGLINTVPPPVQVATTVRSVLVTDRLRQVKRQIEAEQWLAAIEELCRLEEQCRSGGENANQRAEVISLLNLAIDIVPPVDAEPHVLGILQKAAQHDSGRACCRLGEHLRQTDSNAARRQFVRAAELEHVQGYVLLGEMYLNGAPGLPPDLHSAAQNFEDAIRLSDLAEAKFHLAKLILRGETLHRLEKAHDYLTAATEARVPGAAGLLGWCYATGHAAAVDMNRAYKLFQQAWQESEEAGKPDYNALNNLAVCVANGYGVPNADIVRALRHFEKAAEGGNKGALRNLERMPRRIYLES